MAVARDLQTRIVVLSLTGEVVVTWFTPDLRLIHTVPPRRWPGRRRRSGSTSSTAHHLHLVYAWFTPDLRLIYSLAGGRGGRGDPAVPHRRLLPLGGMQCARSTASSGHLLGSEFSWPAGFPDKRASTPWWNAGAAARRRRRVRASKGKTPSES